MGSIVNFDRDLDYVNLGIPQIFFCNQQPLALALKTTSDGLLHDNYASISYFGPNVSLAVTIGYARCLGLHIIGPDITGGSAYRIHGFVSTDEDYMVYIMYGVGPATITTAAAGDFIEGSQCVVASTRNLVVDHTIYIEPFDTLYPGLGYENRPFTVYMMVSRSSHIGGADAEVTGRLSVQRLAVKPPAYITANR